MPEIQLFSHCAYLWLCPVLALTMSAWFDPPAHVCADSGFCGSARITLPVAQSVSAQLDRIPALILCQTVVWSERGQGICPFGLGSAARRRSLSALIGVQVSTHALVTNKI